MLYQNVSILIQMIIDERKNGIGYRDYVFVKHEIHFT